MSEKEVPNREILFKWQAPLISSQVNKLLRGALEPGLITEPTFNQNGDQITINPFSAYVTSKSFTDLIFRVEIIDPVTITYSFTGNPKIFFYLYYSYSADSREEPCIFIGATDSLEGLTEEYIIIGSFHISDGDSIDFTAYNPAHRSLNCTTDIPVNHLSPVLGQSPFDGELAYYCGNNIAPDTINIKTITDSSTTSETASITQVVTLKYSNTSLKISSLTEGLHYIGFNLTDTSTSALTVSLSSTKDSSVRDFLYLAQVEVATFIYSGNTYKYIKSIKNFDTPCFYRKPTRFILKLSDSNKSSVVRASSVLQSDISTLTISATPVAQIPSITNDTTARLLFSSEKGVSNGIPYLDSNGKIPVDQLPDSALVLRGSFTTTATKDSPSTDYLAWGSAASKYSSLKDGITGAIQGDTWICNLNKDGSIFVDFATGKAYYSATDEAIAGYTQFRAGDSAVYSSSGNWIPKLNTISGETIKVEGSSSLSSYRLSDAIAEILETDSSKNEYSVTGITFDNSTYLHGNVYITKASIGLGNVTNLAATGYLTDFSASGSVLSLTIGGTTKTLDIASNVRALTASSTANGTVKLYSDGEQTVAVGKVYSTPDRTYAIQKNSSGQLVVNVPWSSETSSSSQKVETISSVTNTTHYIAFVANNNSSSTAELVYTNTNLKYNPSTGALYASKYYLGETQAIVLSNSQVQVGTSSVNVSIPGTLLTSSVGSSGNTVTFNGSISVTGTITGDVTGNISGSSGSCTGKSAQAGFLTKYSSKRLTSGNIVPKDASEYGGMRKDLVTSSMTDSGHPGMDGHLLTMFWDSDGRWDNQLFISNALDKSPTLKLRQKLNTADYGAWTDIITSDTTGSLSSLATTDKSNLVSAINEVQSGLGGFKIVHFNLTLTASIDISHTSPTLITNLSAGSLDLLSGVFLASIPATGSGQGIPLPTYIPASLVSTGSNMSLYVNPIPGNIDIRTTKDKITFYKIVPITS